MIACLFFFLCGSLFTTCAYRYITHTIVAKGVLPSIISVCTTLAIVHEPDILIHPLDEQQTKFTVFLWFVIGYFTTDLFHVQAYCDLVTHHTIAIIAAISAIIHPELRNIGICFLVSECSPALHSVMYMLPCTHWSLPILSIFRIMWSLFYRLPYELYISYMASYAYIRAVAGIFVVLESYWAYHKLKKHYRLYIWSANRHIYK